MFDGFNLNRPVVNDPTTPADAQDLTQNVPGFDVLFPKMLGGVLQGLEPMSRCIRESAISSRFTKSGTWVVSATGSINWEGSNVAQSDNLASPTVGHLEITLEKVTAFQIAFESDNDHGMFQVTIDGLDPDDVSLGLTLDAESYDGGEGNPASGLVDCYQSSGVNEERYVGWRGLDGGQHTIRVQKLGTQNSSSAGFLVRIFGIEHVPVGRCDEVVFFPLIDDPVRPDDGSITYVGSWTDLDDTRYLRGRVRRSTVDPATLETAAFSFTGTGVILYFFGGTAQGNANIQVKLGAAIQRNFDVGFVSDGDDSYRRRVVISGLGSDTYDVIITRKDENGRWDGSGDNEIRFEGYRVLLSADADNSYKGLALVAERAVGVADAVTMPFPAAHASAERYHIIGMDRNGTLESLVTYNDFWTAPALQGVAGYYGKCPLAKLRLPKQGAPSEIKQSEGEDPRGIKETGPRNPQIRDYRHFLPVQPGIAFYGTVSGTAPISRQILIPANAKYVRARYSGGSTSIRLRIKETSSPDFYRYSVEKDSTSDVWLHISLEGLPEGFYLLELVGASGSVSMEGIEVVSIPSREATVALP